MSYQFKLVTIYHADGKVSRMQFIARAPKAAFDARGARDAGLTLDANTREWCREVTPEAVEREISRTAFPKGFAAPARYVISPD